MQNPAEHLRQMSSVSRRHVLAGLASTTVAATLARSPLFAQSRGVTGLPGGSGWIDVHHHMSPPTYAAALESRGLFPKPLRGWSVEKTLADMDSAGVATAINTIVAPGVWFDSNQQARQLARECNEFGARLAADYPGRFGQFVTLPIPDIEGCLKEIEYAFDALKANGVMLFTSFENKWLGDPFYGPIFEELNRRKAVLYTHPTANACCTNLLPDISSAEIEYGTDTTRAIVRMVYSGSAQRYPDMRSIFSHGGGTMPYLIGRFTNRASRGSSVRDQHDFQAEVSRFYFDTAQTFNPVPMSALKQVVPVSQILFGTDYPYRSSPETTSGLVDGHAFSSTELQLVKRDNVLRLMPELTLLKGAAGGSQRS